MRTDERHEIEAAMGRLLDGTPLRSDGKLRIVALAVEAGVKRHMLTHKHTDLRDLFYARVKARDGATPNEAALREQNSELRRRLDTLRAERDEYKQAAGALARALNVQTIENGAARANRQAPPASQAHEADPVPRRLRRVHRGLGADG